MMLYYNVELNLVNLFKYLIIYLQGILTILIMC